MCAAIKIHAQPQADTDPAAGMPYRTATFRLIMPAPEVSTTM